MEAVKTVGLGCLWLVTVLLIPTILHNRRRRTLWIVLILVAAELTLYRPGIQAPLYQALNGHLVFLGVHLVSVVEAVVVLYLLATLTGRTGYRLAALGSGVAVSGAMATIYAAAHPAVPTVDVPPEVPLAYWHILSIFHTLIHLVAAVLCWYGARKVNGPMRPSLIVLGAGMLLLCVPWALNLAWLLTDDTAWLDPIAPIDAVTGLAFAVAAAPPLALAGRRAVTHHRVMHQLEPLWRELTAAVPDVVLDTHATRRGLPGRRRFLLYRRVIEIRDAMRALRSYVTPQTLQVAQQYVRDQGLTGTAAEAAVTACWLAAAVDAKSDQAQPHAQPNDLTGRAGNDLDDEVAFLQQVAQVHHAPLTVQFLQTLRTRTTT